MRRISHRLGLSLAVLALLTGCGVQTALMDTTPKLDGSVAVASSASQAFYAPEDGLNRLSVGLVAQVPQGETTPRLAAGATYELAPAPEVDNTFPDGDFHSWPSTHLWLPELTGDTAIGQSFLSHYAGLDGITLRAATFLGDIGNGSGRLKDGAPVAVLALPVDGKPVASLPGGSQVRLAGTAEGWARVVLPDGTTGYVPLDAFASLPPAPRVNDRDIILRLYREGETAPVREATLNAREIHDNSHVTFSFPALADPPGGRYRFSVNSPDSVPGNAVAFRYSPTDIYGDGTRYQNGVPVSGDLIFRPAYVQQPVVASGRLDDFIWSGQTNTLDGQLSPIPQTAGEFLRLTIRAGDRPLELTWSKSRPLGGQPLLVEGSSHPPEGALVFNAGFRDPIHPSPIASSVAHRLGRDAGRDPVFFAFDGLLLLAVAGWSARVLLRGARGR